jgi:hypothetical protein
MLATDREPWYTVSRMKQSGDTTDATRSKGQGDVSTEFIWETFDSLFKTVHRQGRRVEELEARIVDLERRLAERNAPQAQAVKPATAVEELPVERAA